MTEAYFIGVVVLGLTAIGILLKFLINVFIVPITELNNTLIEVNVNLCNVIKQSNKHDEKIIEHNNAILNHEFRIKKIEEQKEF